MQLHHHHPLRSSAGATKRHATRLSSSRVACGAHANRRSDDAGPSAAPAPLRASATTPTTTAAAADAARSSAAPPQPATRDVRAAAVSTSTTTTTTTTTTAADAVATPPPPASLAQPRQVRRVDETTINDIKTFHKSQLNEYDYLVQDDWIEGSIPQDLVGTYLRNGPGMQTAGRHTFDGDGQIVAFSFDGSGRVRFTNKFVRTRGFLDEQAVGRPVHRTAFTRGAADGSLLFNPLDMQMKNVANTGVLHWGNRLLALYESNLPYELDATSLNTYGECDMGGQLQSPVLAAHYRVMPGRQQLQQQQEHWQRPGAAAQAAGGGQDGQQQQQPVVHSLVTGGPDGRTLVGFSFNSGFGGADMIFYEFDEAGTLRHAPTHHTLPGVQIALIHDVAVTEDYYVIALGPVDFSLTKFVTQYVTSRCSIAECLEYKPQDKPATVHLVPRPGGRAAGTAPYVINTPAMFVFHHVNTFQVPAAASAGGSSDAKQLLVLDTAGWSDISFENSQHNLTTDYYRGGARPQLQRMVFELDAPQPKTSSTSTSTGRCISRQQLVTRTMEFPCVNWDMHGRQHSHIYCCADSIDDPLHWGPTQCVLKLSFDNTAAAAQDPQQAALQPRTTTQLWDAGYRRYVNEPLFVPRPNPTAEDDGWVLAILHNAATYKGELVILDAQRVADGPVATIRLPHHLAAGLHGSFSPRVLLQGWEEEAARPWSEAINVVRAI